jgi:phosphopantetheinyl transferase
VVLPLPLTVLSAKLSAAPPPSVREVGHLLDASEQRRLARYMHSQDKWRFVLGRGLRYSALKTLFGVNASKLSLRSFGRPFLPTTLTVRN